MSPGSSVRHPTLRPVLPPVTALPSPRSDATAALGGTPAFQVELDAFSGPLDLLLHLLREERLEIADRVLPPAEYFEGPDPEGLLNWSGRRCGGWRCVLASASAADSPRAWSGVLSAVMATSSA